MNATDSPARDLAAALDAAYFHNAGDPRILVPGGFIYSAPTGKARLQRPGKPVVTLGSWHDGTDALVAAFEAATKAGAA